MNWAFKGEKLMELQSILLIPSNSHLLALEHVTDHLGGGADHLGLLSVLGEDPAPRHDHHQLPDVGDVGDGPEGVVHHDLLNRGR